MLSVFCALFNGLMGMLRQIVTGACYKALTTAWHNTAQCRMIDALFSNLLKTTLLAIFE